jgi:hypothetical protein
MLGDPNIRSMFDGITAHGFRQLVGSINRMVAGIAGRLDDAAAEVRHDRLRSFATFTHRVRRPRVILAHETRVADDVGGEDRG